MEREVHRFPDHEALSQAAAKAVCAAARSSVAERGVFSLALCGGESPARLYDLLALHASEGTFPWDRTHVFWADERCVGPEDPESNHGMALSHLLARVELPRRNIHRMRGETRPVQAAAASYERTLRRFFAAHRPAALDLILLGIGSDGHAASLFPASPALEEMKRWVAAVRAPQGVVPQDRLTLTLNFINAARQVWFLASGARKARKAASILDAQGIGASALPAGRVMPQERLQWFLSDAPTTATRRGH